MGVFSIIIESVDSISRDERDISETQYITVRELGVATRMTWLRGWFYQILSGIAVFEDC